MKQSDSNSLVRVLATDAVAGDHPDPDLLTAFAEASLLAREREAVMAHLAGCAACREVLSLCAAGHQPARELELVAAAAAPALVAVHKEGRRPKLRVWLPWAAAAAGVAIVPVVALRFAQKKPETIAALPETKTVAVNAPAVVSAPAPSAAPAAEGRQMAGAMKKSFPAPAPSPPQVASRQPEPAAPQQMLSQDALTANLQTAQRTPPQPIAARGSAHGIVSEQQLQSASAGVAQQLPAPQQSAEARAFAPAVAGSFAKSANARLVAHPHWRINEAGHLQRSLDGGPWEPALTGENVKMRVVSVANGEVWAGGENDRLYRSRDEGSTWQPVALPHKNGAPHVLVHIRFDTALVGTVQASDGTTWTTADGGTTWN